MSTSSQDLQFLTEALPELQAYLLSNELFWPLSDFLPRLTIGSVLLALARCEITHPVEAQKLWTQVEAVRTRWQVAWENKAARETASRLRLWLQFLSNCVNTPEKHADAYSTEVRGRVILEMLLRDRPDAPEKSSLANTDALLRSRLRSGEFIWDVELQVAFPESDFWFLYGSLTTASAQNGREGK